MFLYKTNEAVRKLRLPLHTAMQTLNSNSDQVSPYVRTMNWPSVGPMKPEHDATYQKYFKTLHQTYLMHLQNKIKLFFVL